MAGYQPSAADFEDEPTGTYKPSASDFENEETDVERRDRKIREMGGFKGLAAEALLNLSDTMKSGASFLHDIPKMIPEAIKAEEERPLRPYLVTGGHLAELGKGAFNFTHDLAKKLAQKGITKDFTIPGTETKVSDLIPHIPEDTGVASIFGLDKEKPEDRLYKGLTNALSVIVPELRETKGIEGGKPPPKVRPKQLKAEIEKQQSILDQSHKRLNEFKESLKSHPDYRSATPSTLNLKAADLERKKESLEPIANIPERKVPEAPAPRDTAKMKRLAAAEKTKAQELLSQRLGEGKEHHIEAGKIMIDETKAVKKAASQKFNDTREYLKDKDIAIDKSEDIKQVSDEISKLQAEDEWLPGYAHDTPEIKALQSQLDKLKEPESVKATDVLDVYQTLHKIAKRTFDEIYERGSKLTEIERTAKQKQAHEYVRLADQLGDKLETIGDKNAIKMLKDARKDWSEYASLYSNPVFNYIEKHKAIPVNTMSKLSLGTKGNELLNKIVAKRPDLREKIFAHQYASPSAHNKLLRPSDLNEKYLKSLSESGIDVNDFVEALKQANETEKEVKATAADMKAEDKELADSIMVIAKEQEDRMAAKDELKKNEHQMKMNRKAADLVKRKIKEAKARGENITKLEEQLDGLEAKHVKLMRFVKNATKMVMKYSGVNPHKH